MAILALETQKYAIKIDNFEGPLDLLCHLIDKNKMNIYDINLSEITDQYIEFLKEQEKLNLEIASEFVVMASTLLFLKSKNLLPKQEEEEEEKTVEPHPAEEKYKANRMSEAECKELHDRLVAYVEKEKPYINPDLKMGELAAALHTSSHSLSYLLNQYLNQSYYDFINEYRVAQFKKMVEDNDYSRYTLTALAELCGFSSRASFFRSFKKSTGVTPNEYIRSIGGTAKDE